MVKLHEIYIILKKRGLPAFHAKFGRAELHPDLVSGLLTAISHFAKELRPNEQKDINTIKREDFTIMIEDGNKTFGAIIADFDNKDARLILKRVIDKFEERYDKNLDDFGVNTLIFDKFKDVVVKEFGELLINPFYFPMLLESDKELPEDPFIKKIVNLIDGNKNISEIANSLEVSIEEICQNIALLESQKFIELKIKIEESDIFSPTEKAIEAFSRETKSHQKIIELFGDTGIDMLYALDGKRDLKDITKELQISYTDVLKIIKYLLREELIGWVELFPVMRPVPFEKLMELTANKEEQALLFPLRNLCDGSYALSTLSRKLNLPKEGIKKFLEQFGINVRWIEKKI